MCNSGHSCRFWRPSSRRHSLEYVGCTWQGGRRTSRRRLSPSAIESGCQKRGIDGQVLPAATAVTDGRSTHRMGIPESAFPQATCAQGSAGSREITSMDSARSSLHDFPLYESGCAQEAREAYDSSSSQHGLLGRPSSSSFDVVHALSDAAASFVRARGATRTSARVTSTSIKSPVTLRTCDELELWDFSEAPIHNTKCNYVELMASISESARSPDYRWVPARQHQSASGRSYGSLRKDSAKL